MDSTEELVREGIDRFTEGARVPAGLAGSAVRRHRRRRAALRGGLGSAAAAVTAAAVIAATGGSGPGATGIQTTAYVVAQVSRALSAPGVSNLVEKVSVPAQIANMGGGVHVSVEAADTWEYHGSSRANVYGADGRLSEMLWSRSSVTVSEPLRAWAVVPMPGAILPGANGCVRPGHTVTNDDFFATPSFVMATLRCGGLAVAGHQRIGGEQTIRLVATDRATIQHMTLYVSPKTYLPVRVVELGITANVQWLPPTPVILGLLRTHIPSGFRRVTPLTLIHSNVWQTGLGPGLFATPMRSR